MAFTEEVFKNAGGLFGAHTGRKYEKSEVEEKGVGMWSKPSHRAPDSVVLEIEEAGEPAPTGNGRGKAGCEVS